MGKALRVQRRGKLLQERKEDALFVTRDAAGCQEHNSKKLFQPQRASDSYNGSVTTSTHGATVSVSIDGYTFVTSGKSLYEAVSNAMDAFESSWWKGPKPTRETMFDVSIVGRDERYRVSARRVLEWRKKR